MIGAFLTTLISAPLDFIYWVKWSIAYIFIRIYNACHRRRFDLYDGSAIGDPLKLGLIVPQLERDLESPQTECHLQQAADEVLFYGVNSKSECVLVRVARGPNQVSDAWIFVRLADGKTYHQVAEGGHQQPFEEGKCHNFSCGKLQMHYLAPMRRWRIFYCGMLRETSNMGSEEMVFVKFVFLWKASSDVYDLLLESNPSGFADALANTEWEISFVPPINNVVSATNFYAQSGVITGTISVNDEDDHEMYLFGEKTRNLGNAENAIGYNFTNILGNTPVNGFTFHLGTSSVPFLYSNLPSGFVVQPDSTVKVLKELKIINQFCNDESEKSLKASFIAGEKYEVCGKVIGDPIVLSNGQGHSRIFVEASFVEFTVREKRGYGFILSGHVDKEPNKPVQAISAPKFPKSVPLTVPFSDEVSHFGKISGGKGSSLGKLTKLSNKEKTFTVPKGIIVTTAAYREFLTPEILSAVKHLENIVYGNTEGDVRETCNSVSTIVEKSILPQSICHSITKSLSEIYGSQANVIKFAVRSSSTGEDTTAMSAAGQMDTFLGIQGLEQIFLAVKKCWASQFGHIAVEYKKRYGQIMNSPMAVVIQEMVACEVSGVLFTCDPVTNNPSVITITANYGLGETVVSGSVEPDTITLKRKANGILEFDSVLVGAKQQKLVMTDSGGTTTEDIPEDKRGDSCLTKDLSERLGKISVKIENYYRDSRDIEWGVSNGIVYILQSRPVTNAAAETEFEIKHDLDAPMRCENDYYTVANIGEVMPGATSPLGMDVICNFFGNIFKKQALEKGVADSFLACKYFLSGMLPFYNHMMCSVPEMMTRYGFDTPMSKGFMISIFGRILDEPDLIKFTREKFPPVEGAKPSILDNIKYYRDLFFFGWGYKKVKSSLENYHLNFLKQKTAKETFTALLNSCSDFDKAGFNQMDCTESSSNWNMSLFQILGRAKGSFDSDVYSDFAHLLATSSNVESANVPQAMQEIALQIKKDISIEKFKSMSDEDALQWLNTNKSLAGYKFKEFIKRHGHRCLKELDVQSITWAMNPKLLVKLLQSLSGVEKDVGKKEEKDFDTTLSELHVPLGFISRLMLKFVLPNCRRAVRGREAAKSLTIKSFDLWRQGYRHLARQMVSEGRIPDVDLIFFLPLDEIRELLETRCPSIISRAIYRRKVFRTLDDYKFPEIMHGIPTPVNLSSESMEAYEYVADLTMKGIPVCQGVTKGYARVAMTLEEASHLKQGEILITYCTDIGWSPYFPIISGVVTELGGLISHGAVVSREYGLPCVVGLQGATKLFQTGDYVLLDGKKGTIQRLPQPGQ